MRDLIGSLWKGVNSGYPIIAIVYQSDSHARDLMEELRTIIGARLVVEDGVEAAIRRPGVPVALFAPANEPAIVRDLAGRREQMTDRTEPIVLFLLHGGKGLETLGEKPELASWLGGDLLDAHALETVGDDDRDLQAS